MAALAPRGELAAWPPFARCLLGLELESARGGVPDEHVDLGVAQLGGPTANRLREGLALAPPEGQRPIALRQRPGRRRRPLPGVSQPVLVAGHLGGGTRAPVRGHGESCGVVRGLAAVRLPVRALRRPEAELLPQGLGHSQAALRVDLFHVVDAHLRRELPGWELAASIVGHAQEALGEAAQGVRIDLVSPPERIDDTGLGAAPLVVGVMFGQLVGERVGSVCASLARGP